MKLNHLFQTIFSICTFALYSCSSETNSVEADTDPVSCDSAATYKVTLDASWSADSDVPNFPSNPHFSPLVGTSHKSSYHFWQDETPASAGVKLMAETGSPSSLSEEIKIAIENGEASEVFIASGGVNPSPGSASLIFKVTKEFSFLSVTSMIAPSPDWFVGIDSLNMCDDGNWLAKKEIDAQAWDSGTDSGDDYASENQPTNPVDKIQRLDIKAIQSSKGVTISFGTMILELQK